MAEPTTARERVARAYGAAARAVEGLPARAAYRAATELAELLRELAERAADLRARMAARVREQEGLTVRALAQVLGVSPSKAGALVKRAARAASARSVGRGSGRTGPRG